MSFREILKKKYIFGGNTGDTAETVKKKREVAGQLGRSLTRAPTNAGEGLSYLGQAIAYRRILNHANETQKTLDAQSKATADAEMFGGSGGSDYLGWIGGGSGGAPGFGGNYPAYGAPAAPGPWQPNAAEASEMMMRGRPDPGLSHPVAAVAAGGMMPAPDVPLTAPVPEAGGFLAGSAGSDTITGSAGQDTLLGGPTPYQQPHLTFGDIQPQPAPSPAAGSPAAGNGLAQGIIETASSLGVDPVDLATAISYETAGTFDPAKRGPTTQWGQHRGLIQFGQPQAKKYGVDWNDPLGSQLGPNGAIAKYLRDAGVKPGMGLLDIYSAINAGGVGLYNRSDANNGGAPGTVRDKVEKQMSGHRRKAQALIGGAGKMPFTSTQGRAAPPAGVEPFRYANVGFDVPGDTGSAPRPTAVQYNPQSGQINLPELPPEFRPQRSSREIMAYIQQNGPRMSRQILAIAQRDLQRALDFEDPWKNFQMRKQYAEMIGWEPQSDPLAGFMTDEQEAQLGLDQSGVYRIGKDGKVQIVQEPSKPQEDGEVDPKDLANFRKEFSTLQPVKEFSTQADAYSRILASAANPSAAGDLSLIFQYMKVLDPTSVVRESEFAMAAKAGSYGERIKSAWARAENGERLSDDIRADFVKRAEMLYNESERKFTDLYRQYAGRADRLGYSQEDALNDFRYKGRNAPETSRRPMARPEPQAAPTPAPQAGNAPPESFVQKVPADEDAQGLWDYMTPEQRALFQ